MPSLDAICKNESVLGTTKMVFWEDLLYMPQSNMRSKSYRPEKERMQQRGKNARTK